jgi:hypothetical protein
LHNPACRWE